MTGRRVALGAWIASILTFGLVTSILGAPVARAAGFTAPGVPAITGTAKVGGTLTADPGTWDPAPTDLEYEWLRDGDGIDAATGATYLLTAADLGHVISVRVTASADGVDDASATSAPTGKVAAGTLVTSVPKISGTLSVGSVIEAVTTGWTPEATLSYRWYANGIAVPGATATTYKLTRYQLGKRITVKVSAQLAGYTPVSRTSAATGKVMTAGSPRVVGTLAVGSTLTVSRGTWTGKVSFSYLWLRDGVAIPAATRSSYKLVTADAGTQISVRVTGKRYGYATVRKTSAATLKVVVAATPKLTGSAFVGSTLTLVPGTWTEGTALTYQWLRSGSVITGVVGEMYKVASIDEGKQLSVRVTGRQEGWATVAKTSAKTTRVMKAGTPTISGTLAPGYTLTARPGSWTRYTSFSYQWRRDGVPITGATRATYRLTGSDAGKQVSVTVKGRRTGYTTVSKTSAAAVVGIRLLGWYEVGVDIQPGTYGAAGGSQCYWERYDSDDETVPPVGVMAPHSGPVRMTVDAADRWFYIENCGFWRPLAASGPKATTFGEGDRAVGIDIAPGLYVAPGGQYCFWRRAEAARGERNVNGEWVQPEEGVNGVIASSFDHSGQRIVQIAATDKVFTSGGCGSWRPYVAPSQPQTSFGDGDFVVGAHILPGVWQTATAKPEKCFLIGWSGFGGTEAESPGWIDGTEPAFSVVIEPTDTMISSHFCGTFIRVGDVPEAAPAARGAAPAGDLAEWDTQSSRASVREASAAGRR